jgi:phosphoribosylaminoimidazolecarboxamide formyltransferase/IMP cyclohydrolase
MSRVDSVFIATHKAGERAKGACLASDAFFPKPDGIETAAKAGVRAIIQPGGSISDAQIIEAADELGLSIIFTGLRHFKH